jgi:4a-hydroxytetrahydrobiopterin dehydratase
MSGTGLNPADWNRKNDNRLTKTFLFPDFAAALAFVNRVGAIAEQQGHHPDIHLGWGRVEIETWTHDTGGITEKDLRLAGAIDQAFLAQ